MPTEIRIKPRTRTAKPIWRESVPSRAPKFPDEYIPNPSRPKLPPIPDRPPMEMPTTVTGAAGAAGGRKPPSDPFDIEALKWQWRNRRPSWMYDTIVKPAQELPKIDVDPNWRSRFETDELLRKAKEAYEPMENAFEMLPPSSRYPSEPSLYEKFKFALGD